MESEFTQDALYRDGDSPTPSHASSSSSPAPVILTQRMMEQELAKEEELQRQQESVKRNSNAIASSSTSLGLAALFANPQQHSPLPVAASTAVTRKKPQPKRSKNKGIPVSPPSPPPQQEDPPLINDVEESGVNTKAKEVPVGEMTEAQLRRAALGKLSLATDHALARNIAFQEAVVDTMKKLDAAAKRATQLAVSPFFFVLALCRLRVFVCALSTCAPIRRCDQN